MVACCISCIVVAPVSWLIGPSVSCIDTAVSPYIQWRSWVEVDARAHLIVGGASVGG